MCAPPAPPHTKSRSSLLSHATVLAAVVALCATLCRTHEEPLAFLVVHLMTTVTVAVPTAVVLVNGLFLRRPENPVVQVCACHFVWNAHLIGHFVVAVPFLLRPTYADVLKDYGVFMLFVFVPIELSTGVCKGYLSKKKCSLNWRHRAALGVTLCHVTFFFSLGTYLLRPASFHVTLFATLAFYGYASSTYLPSNPQGQPPEITGSREWPWLKGMLWHFLWDPIKRYMRLRVLFDDDASCCDELSSAAAAAAKTTTTTTTENDAAKKDDEFENRRRRLLLAQSTASAKKALRELAPLCAALSRAHPLRRIQKNLGAAVDGLQKEQTDVNSRRHRFGLELGEAAILGYHPHGIIPFNAALLTTCPEFDPPTRCVVAVDAFVHAIAWMRDLSQWLGARECTREAMRRALDDGRSVVLVPGGQAEIFRTRSWGDRVVVYRGHRGFVRLALKTRTRLVPVFAFGEWELMDNVSCFPRTQAVTRRYLGFPAPFLPYGRFGLPLPRRPPHGVTVVVGRPLDVEAFLLSSGEDPNHDRAVAAAHAAYFARLSDLFDRFKATAGYPDHVLEFQDSSPRRSPSSSSSSSSGAAPALGVAFLARNESSVDDLTPSSPARLPRAARPAD
mmetsp:Transcript_18202/g.55789  ORF Transcript_18202/g.55789 Transcript_18202/m.55789 type:complete len:618 (-) Transcript_18202:148-2001(-)